MMVMIGVLDSSSRKTASLFVHFMYISQY